MPYYYELNVRDMVYLYGFVHEWADRSNSLCDKE